jgi:hypothetical protein
LRSPSAVVEFSGDHVLGMGRHRRQQINRERNRHHRRGRGEQDY